MTIRAAIEQHLPQRLAPYYEQGLCVSGVAWDTKTLALTLQLREPDPRHWGLQLNQTWAARWAITVYEERLSGTLQRTPKTELFRVSHAR